MKMKILIAGVIAVAFLLTVPFVGGDVDKESASAEVDPSNVASIGDTGYATLESAIGSSNANDTITLLNDYTTISKITIDKDLTIDLNDKTLTLGYALELTDGTVVIKDGSIASSLLTAVTVTGESELTSENVVVSVEFEAYRVSGSTDISSPTYGYEPSLTIIGGSVTSAKDCCVFIYGISSLEIEGDASLESRGMYATIQGNGNATSGGTTVKLGACSVINTYVVEQGEPSVSAIYVPQAVTFDIDGATIEGGTGLYIKSGTYTIKNASITGTAHHRGYEYYNNGANGTGDAIVIDTCGYPGGNPAVSIQSGTYSSVYASSVGSYAYGDGNSILTGFITGGTFDDFSAIPYMEDGSSIDIVLSETITLISSIINIDGDKTVNIDLNGNNIEFADGKRFLICNGTLNLTGEGTVRESVPDYSPIMLKGAVGAPSGYSEVSIGADVTVEGWAAVFIDKVSGVDVGSKATIAGTLIGKNDKGNYTGAGVYVNGTVDGAEIIVTGTADISGTGHGMYLAGNADTTIADGAVITGEMTGIEIRAGSLTVNGGTIEGKGTPTEFLSNGNGSTTTGAGIAVVKHTTTFDLSATITAGEIIGYTALYERKDANAGAGTITLRVTGGSFVSGGGDAVYSENCTAFITGGTFDDFSAIPYMEDGSSIDIVLSETITLISSIINIDGDKTVNIDLNGNNIEFADGKRFLICNGTLNLTGEGTVRESVPDYSPIMLKGAVGAPSGYSEVSIGADVTVEGWAAVFIDKVSGVDVGSKATIAGTLIGKNDKGNYTGAGVYVNGTVDGAEIIVTGTADISGTGHGMYLAGNADTTIADGAVITGEMTGIEIRAGSLTVNGGTIEGKGTPTEFLSNGNGSTTTGAGIAVVKHTTTFDLSATITAGEIIGYTALYERKDANAGAGTITLRVTGGSFVSGGGDAVYSENCTAFITGGNFDDKPDSSYYVKYSVSAPSDGTGYTVSPGKSPVISGRSYTFTVTVLSGYTGTVSVTADGTHGKITTYVRDDVTTVTIPDIRSVIKSIKVSGISAETVIITDPETGTVTETTTNTEGTTTQETSTSTNTEGDTSVKTTIIDTATGVATTAVKSDTETKVETTVNTEATVSDDTAVATVTETAIAEALDQVDKATDTIDADDVVPVIEIIATASGDPTDIKDSIVEVAADSLKAIADAGAEVKITTATGEIVLDKDAVSNIADKEGDKVEISIGKASSEDLNEKQRERVGNETVFTLSAKVGTESVHELGGKATITVDYTPLPGEDMSKKTIFYIDDEGEIYVRATVYKDGKLTFETATFSLYFLGEKSTSDAGADNTMLYVGIVIVAIVIVAIAAGVMLKRKGVL